VIGVHARIRATGQEVIKIPREDWIRRFMRESKEAAARDQQGAPMTMQTETEGGES
jgi:hypothetical protein